MTGIRGAVYFKARARCPHCHGKMRSAVASPGPYTAAIYGDEDRRIWFCPDSKCGWIQDSKELLQIAGYWLVVIGAMALVYWAGSGRPQ
jgi:hypothetical protein